ncbi:MAG: type II secretion system protein [Elusimicrobia bacterium]|nr:type II secretion system protein [Elusimicrobiota bacterium]
MSMRSGRGFANPEYLLTLAAVGIVLSIVIPACVRVRDRARDRAALGTVRRALETYRGAHKGESPVYLQDLVSAGLLKELPAVHGGGHSASTLVKNGDAADDAGGWLYDAWPRLGHLEAAVSINCTHTDSHGTAWNSY